MTWLACALVGFSGVASCASKDDAAARGPGAADLSEGPAVFARPGQPGSGAATAAGDGSSVEEPGEWSVAVVTFRGPNHAASAASALSRVRAYQGLGDAFVFRPASAGRDGGGGGGGGGGGASGVPADEVSAVGVGRFLDGNDPRGLDEAERVRGLAGAGGTKPFARAALVRRASVGGASAAAARGPEAGAGQDPGTGPVTPSRPDAASAKAPESSAAFDLSRVRAQYGKAAIVTLQVGVYEKTVQGQLTAADRAEIRQAAELAAAKLRAEGEQAYYFHSTLRSMVTIGIFPEEEVTQKRSAEAAALKKKHPHNLLNGQGYKAGPSGAVRGSEFVRVP